MSHGIEVEDSTVPEKRIAAHAGEVTTSLITMLRKRQVSVPDLPALLAVQWDHRIWVICVGDRETEEAQEFLTHFNRCAKHTPNGIREILYKFTLRKTEDAPLF